MILEITEDGTVFCNFYHHCDIQWANVWDRLCDDFCPVCSKPTTPYYSQEVTPEYRPQKTKPAFRSRTIAN